MIVHFNRSRLTYICIFLLLISLFILNGRPKFIFQSHYHIPWLTNVQHTQPLNCLPVLHQFNWPHVLQSNDEHAKQDNRLTIVIITAQPEFKRLPLTLAALACHLDSRRVLEVMFLVPPKDVDILKPYFSGRQAHHWPWPLSIISDDRLLIHTYTHSYRLQMMFKLVLSQIIQTEYYMLLDSDCVAIWPIHVEQLLSKFEINENKTKSLPLFKAIYQSEDRSDRDNWWPESEQLLQIKPNECVSNNPTSPTIGVTPIILSRTIALRTLCRLQTLYGKILFNDLFHIANILIGDKHFLNKLANWALWRVISGRMWTEYTLYYLTAQCTQMFDTYHSNRSTLSSSSHYFYGLSVWWRTDWTSYTRSQLVDLIHIGLKWRQKEIHDNNGRTIIDLSMNSHSLFTVLQGRQYINPYVYHELFYPLFIKHLKEQHDTQELAKILDDMSERLI